MLRRCPLLLSGRALLDADLLIRKGLAERRVSFELSFTPFPAHVGAVVISGVETFLDLMYRLVIEEEQLNAVQRACGLSDALRTRLEHLTPTVDVDAMPDGTLAFANEPVATVEGPFVEVLMFSALLQSTLERATLVATRSARLLSAAGGDAIVDGSSASVPGTDAALAIARWAHVGGASATTNALAAISLSIPFRSEAHLRLGELAVDQPKPAPNVDDGWGDSVAYQPFDLGLCEGDEEAALIEEKRMGTRAGGFIARSLSNGASLAFPVRCELVALEMEGAWCPRRGSANDSPLVVPGRKRVVRYTDAKGRALLDVVHLASERMHTAAEMGAKSLIQPARAVMRHGRRLEAPEPAKVGRERMITARSSVPSRVLGLRNPTVYRVEMSAGLKALLA